MLRLLLLLLCVVGAWNIKLTKGPTCGLEASSNLIHHNPWLVYLEFWRGDYNTEIRCAATLVDSRHLITAAHCIRGSKHTKLIARLGEYDLASEEDCINGVCADPIIRLEVEEEIIHPNYDGKGYDIAVLRLAEDAPYTDFIRPICLPSGELQPNVIFAASGWGEIPHPVSKKGRYSNIKKIVPLPLFNMAICKIIYEKYKLPKHTICAGGEQGVDTCRGDSGGPLVWFKHKAELWGVTSAGNTRCGTKDFPGIYTNVADHLQWVQNVISRHE